MPTETVKTDNGIDSTVMGDEGFQLAFEGGGFPTVPSAESTETEETTEEPSIPDAGSDVNQNRPVEKKDPVKAMEAELGRQRERARTLEQENSFLKGRMHAEEKPKADPLKEATPQTLIKAQIDWEEMLGAARTEGRDEDVAKAKSALEQIRLELHERTTQEAVTKTRLGDETTVLSNQIQAMTQQSFEKLPALKDADSAVVKAAQTKLQQFPDVLGKLGEVGKIVAVALAVIENPALVSRQANENLVASLTKVAGKTMAKGAGSVDISKGGSRVASDRGKFELQVEAIKNGQLAFADLEGDK